ncbi:radical SAM-associated putative lipoprotein [Parabacteroides sp. OttesenSCG-928-G07]|nr:radical SAM-associated putative lipoprotein [Parabacteroides sp. OttesenSCG-928-G21]MDL2278529.1 radical SAM-associated putative lipoprotein [Parabacteroides sp. OttesenSCG-928-G07]
MKKGHRYFLKFSNWILATLLTLFGVACSSDDEPAPAEYGTPYAKFTVKGKVTGPNGEAIPGIEVKGKSQFSGPSEPGSNEDLTDNNGNYTILAPIMGKEAFKVFFEDIDGEENGFYKTDSIEVKSSQIELTGKDGWFEGEGEMTLNISLKEKEIIVDPSEEEEE